jgi:hypothetical protein
MRIPANALSRALVGCLTACAYAWHQRSLLRAERRALGELNEELLCEARLLAFELNKGASGDPLAVVQDPCLPTSTPERAFADDRARRTRGAGPSASRQTGSCPGPSADTRGAHARHSWWQARRSGAERCRRTAASPCGQTRSAGCWAATAARCARK